MYAVSEERVNNVSDTGHSSSASRIKVCRRLHHWGCDRKDDVSTPHYGAKDSQASFAVGVVFVLVSGVAGWAASHAAFENGQRMDIAPWGENLRFRNAIAGNEVLLSILASIGTAALANVGTKNRSL